MPSSSRRLPPLNGLRVFEVVARHLNFRLAAEEIGVTQGAVAQLIRGLEAELGMKLFLRRPQGLEPTEAGQQYAARIRRAFDLITEATRELRAEPQRLTISVTPSLASRWLIPRLPDFTAAHPTIDLRIVATDRLSNFETDDVDLAVRLGQSPFGPGLNAELLHEQTIIAIGSPLLIEKLGDPGDPGNFARYPLLHDAHGFWPAFLGKAFPASVPASGQNVRFNQTSLAVEAAIAGQGLALASLFLVADDIASGRLARALAAELPVEAGFHIVFPRKPRHPGPVEEVCRWLVEAAAGNRPAHGAASPRPDTHRE
ncbi:MULTISPECIES: LysR substrate-binding domain-containing protein [Bosea]|uniref:LysR substrate-binding domain-containing protein n=1 Tax=Bosea TaxID=85413 RepID=UPI00214FF940|nr:MULTISPECIES: LysR substrate-binding domain-containing protein [Bosea]MCR4524575.1 LysR substrate-binding domain-containing protein [Bosea sp. 47.2.35]MDR6829976.1 LysR family glycine cleavage system transcriptional activator [Bosea robiniae]MDR6896858.1 LysR family glycine cleavage system transcriptional activator [Bosea sp. BE109]MDR7140120.1 LysR family glycine cleavage system transcriptional activator [Bosea sp. BE168]MDR7176817.1 LysR family glycine cleavage system transcriptional acti